MDKTSALRKLKSCLALAKSANPHEAAAAMRQAQKLMAEHDLQQLDVELADVSEAAQKATSSKPQVWETQLAQMVAEALGCRVFLDRTDRLAWMGGRACQPTKMNFVGVGPAAESAAYAFHVLQRQCVAQRREHVAKQPARCKQITKTARGDAFALGWVRGVQRLLDVFAGKDRHVALLDAYMQAKHPKLTSYAPGRRDVGRNIRDDAYEGWRAAQAASLNHGISGGQGRPLIGRD